MFLPEPSSLEIYCDIATPAQWPSRDLVTMTDLDLDVLRDRDTGLISLADEDEFAEHRELYGYPADVVARAGASARELLAAIAAGIAPFDGGYRVWADVLAGLAA